MSVENQWQEWFDESFLKLFVQGKPSVRFSSLGDAHICAYRGNNGCRCGIGWLIPDPNYDPCIEGFGVTDEIRYDGDIKIASLIPGFSGIADNVDTLGFLGNLQACHDRAYKESLGNHDGLFLKYLAQEYRDLARFHNMSAKTVESLMRAV